MAQQLRLLVAPTEDLGLILSSHTAAYNHLQFQSQGIYSLSSPDFTGTMHAHDDMHIANVSLNL